MLPSLREFLFIEQEAVEVDHWRRLPNSNWELASIRDLNAALHLESIGCDLPVAELVAPKILPSPKPALPPASPDRRPA